MRNKLFDSIIIIMMIFSFICTLLYRDLVYDTISYSLHIWVHTLLPSMFPFFVLSDILIAYDITSYIPMCIKRIFSSLFGVTYQVITIFFLSCFSGFPSNARMISTMYCNGDITLDEANHALIFTHFSNPLFILSVVGVLFLHQERYGYIILLSHYLGNVILGIVTRKSNKNLCKVQGVNNNNTHLFFGRVLVKAIQSSIDTLLLILGILTCFLLFSSFIIYLLPLNSYLSAIIKGILEITMGIKEIADLGIPDVYKVVLACMFISFGGISVHLQVYSQIVDTKISYHTFLVARIFHAIISGSICFLLYILNS